MIVKTYISKIDTRMPQNYFEKWYSQVWKKRVGKFTVAPSVLLPILEQELVEYHATIKETAKEYLVTFNSDIYYTMFVLRWS